MVILNQLPILKEIIFSKLTKCHFLLIGLFITLFMILITYYNYKLYYYFKGKPKTTELNANHPNSRKTKQLIKTKHK